MQPGIKAVRTSGRMRDFAVIRVVGDYKYFFTKGQLWNAATAEKALHVAPPSRAKQPRIADDPRDLNPEFIEKSTAPDSP